VVVVVNSAGDNNNTTVTAAAVMNSYTGTERQRALFSFCVFVV
jgi:hypothetical protein